MPCVAEKQALPCVISLMRSMMAKVSSCPWTNYAECFDRVDPRLATRMMEMADIPSDVVLLFREVWTDHRRLRQFGRHTADRWESVTSSLLQGDAICPLALNAVVLVPLCATDAAPDGHHLG